MSHEEIESDGRALLFFIANDTLGTEQKESPWHPCCVRKTHKGTKGTKEMKGL